VAKALNKKRADSMIIGRSSTRPITINKPLNRTSLDAKVLSNGKQAYCTSYG